jgi:iron-sulfur cluster repair protein YtfE (RIC family)
MTATPPDTQELEQKIQETLIRDLVEDYPEAMPVLDRYGIDTCCGGGRTVPQAAEAHGLDQSMLNDELLRTIRGEG